VCCTILYVGFGLALQAKREKAWCWISFYFSGRGCVCGEKRELGGYVRLMARFERGMLMRRMDGWMAKDGGLSLLSLLLLCAEGVRVADECYAMLYIHSLIIRTTPRRKLRSIQRFQTRPERKTERNGRQRNAFLQLAPPPSIRYLF